MLCRPGILFSFLIFGLIGYSQNILMNGMDTNFSQCGGFLIDSGTEFGNYPNNEDVTITICSDSPGEGVTLNFISFALEDGFDFLSIYDGPDVTAPQVPGSPFTGTSIIPIAATGTCLTINFTSNMSITDVGWAAGIGCAPIVTADPCLVDYTIDIQPPPLAGECFGDTTYRFCLTIDDWDASAPNAFHGFSVDLGPAWDVTSTTPISAPGSCDGLGTWGFYPAVTSTGTGSVFGQGFYYDDGDGDPGNNAGDVCPGALPWEFCWESVVSPCASFLPGENADVTINTYSDGESGIFSDPACSSDEIIVLSLSAGCAPCVAPPTVTMEMSGDYCPSDYPVPLTFTFTGTPPFTVNYTADAVPATFTTALFNDFTFVGPGTYELVSVSDANCFDAPAAGMVELTVSDIPTISLASDTAFCTGQTVDLTVGFEGTAPFDFQYSIDAVVQPPVTSFTDSYIITTSTPGTYSIVSFSDASCPGDDFDFPSVIVTEVLEPSINLISGDTLCPGQTADIAGFVSGTPPFEITLFLDGVFSEQLTEVNAGFWIHTVSAPGVYTVDRISNIGCEGTAIGSAEAFAHDTARVTLSGEGAFCLGDMVEISLDLEGTAPWTVTYSIDAVPQAPLTINGSPFTIMTDTEGFYELVSASDDNCDAELIGNVDVMAFTPPTAELSGDITLCEGESGLLSLVVTGTAPFVISYAIDGVVQPNDTLFFPAGDYEVELPGLYTLISVEDASCSGTVNAPDGATVTVLPIPTASISGGDSVCVGQNVDLLVELSGTPDFTVDVYLNGAPYNVYPTSNDSLFITTNIPGEYTVFQVLDTQCSSPGVDSSTIANYALPEITSTADSLMCFGDTLALGGFATDGFGGPYSYQWVIAGDTLATDSINVIVNGPQAYEFLVDDGCGVPFSDLTVLTVYPFPSFDATNSNLLLCGAGTVVVDSEPPLSLFGDSCVWTINGQTYNICDSVEVTLPGAGAFDIGIFVETIEGCVIDTVLPGLVEVNDAPIAGFSWTPDQPTITQDLLSFQNLSSGASNYYWFYDSLLFSNQFTPSLDLPDAERPYSVTICLAVENEFGCVDTTCAPINIDGEFIVYIPDAFTPDDDKVNDSWAPSIIGAIPESYLLRVFGRSGQIIWESSDINERWLGQGTDKESYYAGDSIYQWQLELRRYGSIEKRNYQGIVTLVR